MNKEQAETYIEDLPKFTAKNSLDHTREFLARLGDPEKGRKILHVAGTNGKGSVCAYMQAILLREAKHIGMFISPHLERINERIKIDGKDITDSQFLRAFSKVMEVVSGMQRDGLAHPSYFEFLFGMAMYAFAEADVEYIILETGLGGRLDATNAVQSPAVAVITSISLDHTEILGNTLEKIAAEKAGIMKRGVPVIFMDGEPYTPTLEQAAEKAGAPCIKISKNAYEIQKIGYKHIDFSTMSAYDKYTTWELKNGGIYQAQNAVLALKAMETLFPKKTRLNSWRCALADVVCSGRMEEILPDVIVDGAHNAGAVEAFVESVRSAERKRTILLFSAVREKDCEQMIRCLCRKLAAETYIITEINDVRGADPERLREIFRRYAKKAEVLVERELPKAFQLAMEKKGEDGRVYCLGSLYLVGMIKELTGGAKKC